MTASIMIIGAGGHGKVIADILECIGSYAIEGFLDDQKQGDFYGYPVLGALDVLPSLHERGIRQLVIAVGDNQKRKELMKRAEQAGLELPVIIHPSAQVARTAKIQPGTVVMPNVVVGPDTKVGLGCILNTSCSVDHDCSIADFAHISPGAHLAGGVQIGAMTHIGIGSSIRENIRVGKSCVIGAGSVVVEDLPDNCTAYGVPAKPVKK